jgi:hypothetical protein
MSGKNGFRNDGAQAAGANEPQNCGDQMNCEDNQVAHEQMLAARNPVDFRVI